VTEKKKPRWQRILALEALAREMDELGAANRRICQVAQDVDKLGTADRQVSQAAQPERPPLLTPQGRRIADVIFANAVVPGFLVGLLIDHFVSINFLAYFVLMVLAGLYNLPTIIAFMRDHKQKWAIWALNLVGGWSVIAWVGAFIWAFIEPQPPQIIYVTSPPAPPTVEPRAPDPAQP
jgi:hypothetical protein